jgi:hypothetical protein
MNNKHCLEADKVSASFNVHAPTQKIMLWIFLNHYDKIPISTDISIGVYFSTQGGGERDGRN